MPTDGSVRHPEPLQLIRHVGPGLAPGGSAVNEGSVTFGSEKKTGHDDPPGCLFSHAENRLIGSGLSPLVMPSPPSNLRPHNATRDGRRVHPREACTSTHRWASRVLPPRGAPGVDHSMAVDHQAGRAAPLFRCRSRRIHTWGRNRDTSRQEPWPKKDLLCSLMVWSNLLSWFPEAII
jgi:hypothetical protein